MADIPHRLYKAMKHHSFGLYGIPHLGYGHAVRLGTWLPILQGIAEKAFRDIRHVSVDKVFATGMFTKILIKC